MNPKPNESDAVVDREARLTAYVLGELPVAEADEIRRQLDAEETLKREVEGIRGTVETIATGLKAEPAPGLTMAQRAEIARGGDADESPVIFSFRSLRSVWGGVALAAAACLAIVLVWPVFQTARQRPSDVARVMEPAASDDAGAYLALDPGDAIERKAGERGRQRGLAAVPGEAAATSAPTAEVQLERLAAPAPASGPMKKEEMGTGSGPSAGGGFGTGGGGDVRRKPLAEKRSAPGDPLAVRGTEPGRRDRSAQEGRPPLQVGKDDVADLKLRGGYVAGEDADVLRQTAAPAARLVEAEESRENDFGLHTTDGVNEQRKVPLAGDIPVIGELFDQPGEQPAYNREAYGRLVDNEFQQPTVEPLSTVSADVDTASYANVRRFLTGDRLPPAGAVRVEEMINYFDYAYEPPSGEHPFSVSVETGACPWNDENALVRVGLKGRVVDRDMRPATNLVFLVDVSGSMGDPNKLPLVRSSLKMLVDHLTADDRVAIVTYATQSSLALPSTYCDQREAIVGAIDAMTANGSTNGAGGIQLAYSTAEEGSIKGGVNRVILCTDGDFNVGISATDELVRFIEKKRKGGVFLSVLGFGRDNWQDVKMEAISNSGNGNFAYIDSLDEARKVLVDEMAGTLVTIAKDVKLQVEFNPARVAEYRLIGYANRKLETRDFEDDLKDAGDIGAGHAMTVLYEVVPGEAVVDAGGGEGGDVKLRYQSKELTDEATESDEILAVKVRYKDPDGETSKELEHVIAAADFADAETTADFRFQAAVASFGMVLRDSPHKGSASFDLVLDLARQAALAAADENTPMGISLGTEITRMDAPGTAGGRAVAGEPTEREKFIRLVERAKALDERARQIRATEVER